MLCLYLEGVTELELNNTDFCIFLLVCKYLWFVYMCMHVCMCEDMHGCESLCMCMQVFVEAWGWCQESSPFITLPVHFFDLFCHKINTGLPGTQVIIPVCENPWSYLLCHGISSKSTKELPHCHSVPNPTPHTQSLSLTWERQQEREMAQIVRLGPFYCP